MENRIKHPHPGKKYFCLAFPGPQGSKADIIHAKKTVGFVDPETNQEYDAILEDMFWYPVSFISNAVAKLCVQKTAKELEKEMNIKYKLYGNDEVCLVQFCLKTN